MIRPTALALALAMSATAIAQSNDPAKAVPVSPDNFARAESDMYFAEAIKLAGGIGRFDHRREVMNVNKQTVVRANRDTLYSAAVFDLDAGPVTITLPDAGKRFMSLMAVNEDEYAIAVDYGAGNHTYTKDQIGTRYVLIAARTFVDPGDPGDLGKAHALQDAIKVQQANKGSFEAPRWDPVSQKKVREALIALAGTLPDTKGMFGTRKDTDPVRHLIGAASGWGGNPDKDATYLTVTPPKNDGKTVYRLTVRDVPVDGFWSISMYNSKGYFEPNTYNAYAINNLSGKKNADGSVTVQFGGCDGKIPNCLPTTPGWNYWVRLYRPRAEILDGSWKFPEPIPAP
ncbi:DUF1254 domain-containing protein [Dyella jiangningensis]|uniref:Carboxylesterase n=1 Tax=Dyella jiangningensis TaxID=1379159 RepID=A0A328P2W2_9GAMM|nr:DUF1254 domain-containing protein [Dyella jiangningensis]RAO74524.1 carboxylesterase [Dyella jiangningensis]